MSLPGRKDRGDLWGLFYASTNPTYRAPLSRLHQLPKAPPLNTIPLEVLLQRENLAGPQTLGP